MIATLRKFAFHQDDPDDIKVEKLAAIIVAGSCCIAGTAWAIMYYLIFGFGLTAILPAIFVVIVAIALFISHKTKNHYWAVYAQIICIMYITALIQWSIGDMFDSGFVLAWALVGPVTALTFFSIRQSTIWFFLYIVNILITVLFDDFFAAHAIPVDDSHRHFFFAMNLGVSGTVVFVFASYFVANTLKEKKKSDVLLRNILPNSIAKRLKSGEKVIADKHEQVYVLFADIRGFTHYSSIAGPEEVVTRLDQIFNAFDVIARKHNLEKIKTIGDAYMVAAGIPEANKDGARDMARMALEMLNCVDEMEFDPDFKLSIRIGMHCGPAVAGVIGQSKFAYDLWGDTVNVASRMESTGEAGKIHLSAEFADQIKKEFNVVERGIVSVKGKGQMKTFFLLSKRE